MTFDLNGLACIVESPCSHCSALVPPNCSWSRPLLKLCSSSFVPVRSAAFHLRFAVPPLCITSFLLLACCHSRFAAASLFHLPACVPHLLPRLPALKILPSRCKACKVQPLPAPCVTHVPLNLAPCPTQATTSSWKAHVVQPLLTVRDELTRTFRDRPSIVSPEVNGYKGCVSRAQGFLG